MLGSQRNLLIWFTLFLIPFFYLSACNNQKGVNNQKPINVDNIQTNSNLASNLASPTPPSSNDLALKNKIEEALKKEGFKDIKVDLLTTPPTLRGDVPKGKMPIAILIAEKVAEKKLTNGLTEK